MQLDAPEPRVAVKLQSDVAAVLREQFEGIIPVRIREEIEYAQISLN